VTDYDPVKKPKHYNAGKIEVINFIEDQNLGYHLGNVIKYVTRAPHKGEELQDLKKAACYLQRKIWLLEIKNGKVPEELKVEPNETEKDLNANKP